MVADDICDGGGVVKNGGGSARRPARGSQR